MAAPQPVCRVSYPVPCLGLQISPPWSKRVAIDKQQTSRPSSEAARCHHDAPRPDPSRATPLGCRPYPPALLFRHTFCNLPVLLVDAVVDAVARSRGGVCARLIHGSGAPSPAVLPFAVIIGHPPSRPRLRLEYDVSDAMPLCYTVLTKLQRQCLLYF